jgi:hypothetical protein
MLCCGSLVIAAMAGCKSVPGAPEPRVSLFHMPAAAVDRVRDSASRARNDFASEGALVVLDSLSFRPEVVSRGGSGAVYHTGTIDSTGAQWAAIGDLTRTSVVTTYQGGRYHPETIRALAGDSLALALAARAIVLNASSGFQRFVVDAQGATPGDLPRMVDVFRAVGEAARRVRSQRLNVIVPPTDTVSYPTAVLARVADFLTIRLYPEHREGTAPGPLTSPEFITRAIGMRAKELGVNRLAAELPLFGFRWNRDGATSTITYDEAQALVLAEAGEFRRDPASRFLVATGRSGWTVWVPDAQTTAYMIDAVKKRGITQIYLAGPVGSDRSHDIYTMIKSR